MAARKNYIYIYIYIRAYSSLLKWQPERIKNNNIYIYIYQGILLPFKMAARKN